MTLHHSVLHEQNRRTVLEYGCTVFKRVAQTWLPGRVHCIMIVPKLDLYVPHWCIWGNNIFAWLLIDMPQCSVTAMPVVCIEWYISLIRSILNLNPQTPAKHERNFWNMIVIFVMEIESISTEMHWYIFPWISWTIKSTSISNKYQTITWTCSNLNPWCHMASPGPLSLTWINFNLNMDEWLHPLQSVGWITYPSPNFNGVTNEIWG